MTKKKRDGVVVPRGLTLRLATHFRLSPGAELTALAKLAGRAIEEGNVGGEDVAVVIAYVEEARGAATRGKGGGGSRQSSGGKADGS